MMTLHKDSAIAKQSAVTEYVTQLVQRSDGKFLVFAHHLAMLDAVAQAAQKAKVGHLPHRGVCGRARERKGAGERERQGESERQGKEFRDSECSRET